MRWFLGRRLGAGIPVEAGVAVMLLVAATAACGPLPAQRASEATAAVQPDSAGALRPGDIVRLRIWREPDLSGEFPVDETGMAVFPRIGPVKVTTESSASLRDKMVEAYAKFLNHNAIEVTLLRRIQVLGAVRQPGVYPVDPTMTISDVLAVAGGTTPDGNPDKLELIRAGKPVGSISRQSLVGESRVRSGDQIFVPERNWLRRNGGIAAAAVITTVTSLLVTRAFR